MGEDWDNLPPEQRFSDRAGHYAKSRPGYPSELLRVLAEEVGLTPASIVADVGSGTGILSELLLRNGNEVFAIEPNARMRQIAERALGAWPKFYSIDAAAEGTTLPDKCVDGVTVAQAFHWFDQEWAVCEFRRILRPGGFVALIWNARKTDASPFMIEYERIVKEFGSDFARSGRELVAPQRLRELLGADMRTRTLANFQDLDWSGLCGRVLSASYMPMPSSPQYQPMMKRLEEIFARCQINGLVRLEYDTEIYLCRLR